jgi:acyl carrier protein
MKKSEILKEINKIFIDVFEDNSIVLTEATTTTDVEAWDSLNHIQMITAVEKHYKIRFKLNDLLNFKNVGDLCSGVEQNLH